MREGLIESAARLVRRDGATALTMRALAAEAGCAVGLPYKLFANREALVSQLLDRQFRMVREAMDAVVAAAGEATVADNLASFADALLGAEVEVIRLAGDLHGDLVGAPLERAATGSGFIVALASTVPDYVRAEKRAGRIDDEVDEETIGFLVTGALHNLVVSGPGYPRPDAAEIRRHLAHLAALL
ncbi:MAG: TetR/AcrR family transcriptional regulator [Actinomycetota bacterium]|nr:TetR/AcrR family transcriptional regulator [Actinomycetota bacterium]